MQTFRLWIYSLIVRNLPETRCFALKRALLRWCGATIGANVRICSSAIVRGNGRLVVGDDVWIGAGCLLSSVGEAEIRMGSHIDLGPQVMILTGSHEIDPMGLHIGGRGTAQSVTVGDGCWLGARATILPGVALPEKTLAAAGAVVTKSPSAGRTLLAGVPAREKKAL